MSTPNKTSNETYSIAMSDIEIDRLLEIARFYNEDAKDGFRRAGLKAGDVAIDVGCGSLGALPVLAEAVGPTGKVVGLDMNAENLAKAREILNRRRVTNVELSHGNVNSISPQSLFPPGPFDVAFCRLFLFHQSDVPHTFRQIAALMRPGGHIVAHELLYVPELPKSDPDVPEFDIISRWFYEVIARAGGSPDVPRQFHGLCQKVGLREISIRGFSTAVMHDTAGAIRSGHDSVVGMRTRIMQYGIASEEEVFRVLQGLLQASEKSFQAYFPTMFVELVAQVPDHALSAE